MTRAHANDILDAARNGADVPLWQITKALVVTGDLEPDYTSQTVAPVGSWERRDCKRMAHATPFDGLLA